MKARAAIFCGVRQPFEIREFEIPEVEERAVLIRVSLANVCGSDVHMWRGESPFPAGMVGGHEMVGRIARLGREIKADAAGRPLREGDRVVAPYFLFCGTCRPCQRGNRTACQAKLKYWTAPADAPPHFRGAYAEYYYSPAGNPVFKVPDGVPDEAAAPANCALSQVIQGLHEAAMRPGDAVVIQGAGGLGIYATAVARGMGARAVIVLDREEGRLALARRFGAHEAVDVKGFKDARELASRVRELTDGQGADLVMGLTGVPESVPEGLRMLAPGGRMVEIGNIGIGVTAAVDPGYMVLRGLSLRTAICYEAWALGAALEFLAANRGRLPLDAILSHRFPFERINEAMERADQGELFRATLDLTA